MPCFLMVSKYLLLKYLETANAPKYLRLPPIYLAAADSKEYVIKPFAGINLRPLCTLPMMSTSLTTRLISL